jgi:hypothetical protein
MSATPSFDGSFLIVFFTHAAFGRGHDRRREDQHNEASLGPLPVVASH